MGPRQVPANEARNEIPNPIGASIGPVRAGHYPVRDISIRNVRFALLLSLALDAASIGKFNVRDPVAVLEHEEPVAASQRGSEAARNCYWV
jgi:hypothetical protein